MLDELFVMKELAIPTGANAGNAIPCRPAKTSAYLKYMQKNFQENLCGEVHI